MADRKIEVEELPDGMDSMAVDLNILDAINMQSYLLCNGDMAKSTLHVALSFFCTAMQNGVSDELIDTALTSARRAAREIVAKYEEFVAEEDKEGPADA